MSVKRFCDRCNEETTLEITKYLLRRCAEPNRYDLGGHPPLERPRDIELCSTCDNKFTRFMNRQKDTK